MSSEAEVPQVDPAVYQQAIRSHAEYLGMDLEKDGELLWLAEEALTAPLDDEEWEVGNTDDEEGKLYYFNKKTGESIWEHPLDGYYKQKYKELSNEKGALTPHATSNSSSSSASAKSSSMLSPPVYPHDLAEGAAAVARERAAAGTSSADDDAEGIAAPSLLSPADSLHSINRLLASSAPSVGTTAASMKGSAVAVKRGGVLAGSEDEDGVEEGEVEDGEAEEGEEEEEDDSTNWSDGDDYISRALTGDHSTTTKSATGSLSPAPSSSESAAGSSIDAKKKVGNTTALLSASASVRTPSLEQATVQRDGARASAASSSSTALYTAVLTSSNTTITSSIVQASLLGDTTLSFSENDPPSSKFPPVADLAGTISTLEDQVSALTSTVSTLEGKVTELQHALDVQTRSGTEAIDAFAQEREALLAKARDATSDRVLSLEHRLEELQRESKAAAEQSARMLEEEKARASLLRESRVHALEETIASLESRLKEETSARSSAELESLEAARKELRVQLEAQRDEHSVTLQELATTHEEQVRNMAARAAEVEGRLAASVEREGSTALLLSELQSKHDGLLAAQAASLSEWEERHRASLESEAAHTLRLSELQRDYDALIVDLHQSTAQFKEVEDKLTASLEREADASLKLENLRKKHEELIAAQAGVTVAQKESLERISLTKGELAASIEREAAAVEQHEKALSEALAALQAAQAENLQQAGTLADATRDLELSVSKLAQAESSLDAERAKVSLMEQALSTERAEAERTNLILREQLSALTIAASASAPHDQSSSSAADPASASLSLPAAEVDDADARMATLTAEVSEATAKLTSSQNLWQAEREELLSKNSQLRVAAETSIQDTIAARASMVAMEAASAEVVLQGKALKEEEARLRAALTGRDAEVQALQSRCEDLGTAAANEAAQHSQQLSTTEKELAQLQEKLASMESEMAGTTAEAESATSLLIQSLRSSAEAAQRDQGAAESKLEALSVEASKLRALAAAHADEVALLLARVSESQGTIATLTEELVSAKLAAARSNSSAGPGRDNEGKPLEGEVESTVELNSLHAAESRPPPSAPPTPLELSTRGARGAAAGADAVAAASLLSPTSKSLAGGHPSAHTSTFLPSSARSPSMSERAAAATTATTASPFSESYLNRDALSLARHFQLSASTASYLGAISAPIHRPPPAASHRGGGGDPSMLLGSSKALGGTLNRQTRGSAPANFAPHPPPPPSSQEPQWFKRDYWKQKYGGAIGR